MWLRVIGLALSYFAVARLSLLMAIPPGYATAFWPAAGVAVAGLLLFGYRAWPGVLLGSFVANLTTTFEANDFMYLVRSLTLPLAIAAGASLQALVGAVLVTRWVGFPDHLNREHVIARLLCFAGPMSCCVNATVGAASLWLTNRIANQEIGYTWWTWWIGDTIGVFLAAPVILIWAMAVRTGSVRRAITITLPIGVLASMVVGLFVHAESRERKRLQTEFGFQTQILTRALENRIDFVLQGLNRVHTFHGKIASPAEEMNYNKAAQDLLKQRPGLSALTWTPRIRKDERHEFEQKGKCAIRQLQDRQLVTASVCDEYFPILYREPHEPTARGFDVAGEADRLAALKQATRTGEPIASTPIAHLNDADRKSILVFLPIYQGNVIPSEVQEREEALRGFVIAILQMDSLLDVAWTGFFSDGIDFWITDDDAAPEKRLAYYRQGGHRKSPEAPTTEPKVTEEERRHHATKIRAAGRQWTLQFAASPEYLATHRSLQAWVVLAGGMLCTGLLGAVLLVVTGRAQVVAELVDERTSELARANAAMKEEIEERARVEAELRQREESLRQSEERFRLLIEGTTDYAIYMLDARGNVVSWNAGAERIQGYRAEEVLGTHFSCFFPEKDVRSGRPTRELAAAARLGRSEEEGWRVRKDGTRFWVNAVVTPVCDAAGEVRGYWKIIRDLTERKLTEERFRGLLESAPDAVVIASDDGKINLVNRQTELLFGYSRDELFGRSIEMLIPERFRSKHVEYRNGYVANPSARPMGATLNLFGLRKDGSEVPIEISLSPMKTESGLLVISSIRDISQRKKAEEALDETRRFIHRIAEMTPSILYVYDIEKQYNVFVNRRLETFLGYAWEEQPPQMPTLLSEIHPEDVPRVEWANEQCQSVEDGAVIETEYRVRHANGEWRWLSNRNTVFVRDSEGNPTQILGAAQDITDRKRLEQEVLDIAASEQRRIGQELHDGTGQELTGLCMLSDNLSEALQESSPQHAATAQRIASGLRHALGHVRLLSRGLIPVEVDAEGLMAALTELCNRIGHLHGIQCEFEYAAPVLVEDNHSATQLYRIAQEAITNALKHGQATKINVVLEARGHYVTMKVVDNGIGLSDQEEVQEGVGLRIMRYRAGQIGAHFTVRQGPTGGTVVTCTLYRGSTHGY